MSIEVTVEYAHREWNSYDHVVHIRNYQQLQAKVAELEAEVERLKRTNSSYASLTKAQESQLTNLRQRLYQLKGADSAIDSERQANCDLTEQLATLTKQRDLAVEAIRHCIAAMGSVTDVKKAMDWPQLHNALILIGRLYLVDMITGEASEQK